MKTTFLKYHKYVVSIVLIIGILAPFVQSTIVFAASPWTQTDWSGSTASGAITTNPTTTYESKSNTAVSSTQVTLDAPEKFTNTGFETNLNGWNVPFSSTASSHFAKSLQVSDNDNLSFGNGTADQPFSISVWAKKDWNGYYLSFLSKLGGSNNEWVFRNHFWSNTLSVYFLLYDKSTGGQIGKTLVLQQRAGRNNWVHIVGTYDGSGTSNGVKVYVNGVLGSSNTGDVSSYSNATSGTYVAMENNTDTLYVGLIGSTYTGSGFLDEISLWSKELTANEVAEIYNYEQPTDLQNDSGLSSAVDYLRAWWRMGEGGETAGGGTIYDVVGDYDMTQSGLWNPGATAFYNTPPGRSNFSVDFDGTNEYVSIADADTLSFTSAGQDQPFTLSGWLYMDDATSFPVFSKGATTSREYSFDTMGGAGDRLRLTIQNPDGTVYIGAYSTSAITAYEGQWVHVAATYSGSEASSGIKLYLNGTELATTSENVGNFTGMTNGTGTAKIANFFGDIQYANGKIDDLSLWSKALSQSEISELASTGAPTMLRGHSAVANLVSWWRFDHAWETAAYTNTSAFDTIGSNAGTMTNTENADFVTATPAPTITRDTSVKYNSTTASAKIVNSAISGYNFTQSVNVGDTDSYNLVGYAYTTGSAVTSSDVVLVANGTALTTSYTSMGSGWYKMSATVTGTASSIAYGAQVKSGKTVYLDNMSLSNYEPSGTLTSNIFDTEQASAWGAVTYNPTTYGAYSNDLDGSVEYVAVADNDAFSFGNGTTDLPFSWCTWAKPDNPNNSGVLQGLISKNSSISSGYEYYSMIYNGSVRFILGTTGSSTWIGRNTNSSLLTAGVWYHLCGTYDGNKASASIKIYVNGVQSDTAWNANGTYGGMNNTTSQVTLGAQATNGGWPLDGKMANPAIWNKELSQAEITEIYDIKMGYLNTLSSSANLVSAWSFPNGTSDYPTMTDYVSGRNGTMTSQESGDINSDTPQPGVSNGSIKVRTGNVADMSDAVDWATCTAITSGADISDNNCVDDGDRYIQYQVSLATSNVLYTPSLNDISVAYELGGMTISSSGTQRSILAIPSTSQNLGGAFTIVKPGAVSATVTSITIANTGTVDGADIENIKIYTKEQATCTDFIPSTATLFGTVADMTGNTATVTGSVVIDSDQTCVYVQLDVADAATAGETIELQITNPSTDVVSVGESITPATAVAITGTTTLGVASSESSDTIDVTTTDGCTIRFSNVAGTLTMTESGGGACPSGTYALTSDRVTVSDLAFTELTSPDGYKTIQIEMTLTDISTNEQKEFSFEQDFATSVTIR